MSKEILRNRLTALGVVLDELTLADAGGLSESAVAALSLLAERGAIAIQAIAAGVGLTHSATVRLVDRLEKDWLVHRRRRQGREVLVELTARGKRRARDLATKRGDAIGRLVEGFDEDGRTALAAAVDRMLAAAVADAGVPAARICRLCLREACSADCPVAAAAEAAE